LLTGLELLNEIDNRTYSERLENDSKNIIERIEKISESDDERDKIFSEFCDATSTHTEVFFELGMKASARLIFQLLCQDN